MDAIKFNTVGVKSTYETEIRTFPTLKSRKIFGWLPYALSFVGLAVFAYFLYRYCYNDYMTRVYSHAVIEAGDVTIAPEDFLRNPERPISFTEGFDIKSVDTRVPGDYEIPLTSNVYRYVSILTVEDTTAPTGEPVAVGFEYGNTAKPEDFVKNVDDIQAVDITFSEEPDFKKCGLNPVYILLTDASGNETVVESTVNISPFRKEVTLEAGEGEPTPEQFMFDGVLDYSGDHEAQILTSMEDISLAVPGEYKLYLKRDGITYRSLLKVVDTTMPEVTGRDFRGFTTSLITPKTFIKEAKDNTELTMTFAGDPDFKTPGEKEVIVEITDLGGNTVSVSAKAVLDVDTAAPVINGARNITIIEGKTASYKSGVSVRDNCDTDIALNVEAGAVNTKAEGTYPLTFWAQDRAGNRTEKTVTVTVVKERIDEAQVRALANDVIGKIITPDMSDRDKLTRIYNWVRGHMHYAHSTNHSDWVKAAYNGLTGRTGDCYMYAATSKALLDAAGIKNMMIDTYPLRNIHFWNLVDIGEGWRHFDTVPREGGGVFLYWDDASITAYSNAHGNSHIYDRNRFPGIP